MHQLPEGWKIGDLKDVSGMWPCSDTGGASLGWIARTLPAASDAVGYRGPTEASILIGTDFVIDSVGLLGSDDTQEHVDAVRRDRRFFDQFHGWVWGALPSELQVDAVSGATLTSLALAEGVIRRMGVSRPSLVFPESLTVEEIHDWYPTAASIDEPSGQVFDLQQMVVGRAVRTGSYADGLIGYQGPTELLLRVGSDDLIEGIRIRRSFDNEPYVDYVRTEAGFWKRFVGMSLSELASFRPQEEGVEGVSGATMTSQTVADTLVAGAGGFLAEAVRRDQPKQGWMSQVHWEWADVATLTVIVMAGLISHLRWFRFTWFRRAWLLLVVGIIGFWAGNLISMALIAGWSAEGIAWRLAPGLSAMAFVALVLPPISKGNPYCNHLCPHGALQQLVRPSRIARRRRKLSPGVGRLLVRVPGGMLVIAYLTLLIRPSVDLSSWEPFHAYLVRIAGWSSLALATGSLVLAVMIPMAYCRWGCPTGRLMDYLRLSARSGRIQPADLVGVLLLAIAGTRQWWAA